MMRIAVCMKQVPAYSDGLMDPKTGLLLRSGLETVVNPYDLAALETALRLKESLGSEVIAFSMGPQSAEKILREALARGADHGVCITDPAFAGADVLATSYTLMQAILTQGPFELILCGRQTTDGDTAQVGGELAAWLGIPNCNWVSQIEAADEHEIYFWQQTERVKRKLVCTYPCLLSIEKTGVIPRLPSLKNRIAANKKEIRRLCFSDLSDSCREHYGIKGSATAVRKIYSPKQEEHKPVKKANGLEAALQILSYFKDTDASAKNLREV